ncbi:nop53 protein [Wolffia australiana]
MGKKAKTSRKGKKAWRANISTDDIEEYFEKATKDARSGGNLASVPSESLFYHDKASKDIPIKKKIEKNREKVLRYESILLGNPFVQPVPSSKLKKREKKILPISGSRKEGYNSAFGLTDLWSEEEKENKQAKKKSGASLIPAVEVEPPGCSFNPSFEAHQDALAEAVAVEMKKIYQVELGPQPVPLTVYGEAVDEDEKYFLDASDGEDDPEDEAEGNVDGGDALVRTAKTKRVTRTELNRRSRRKLQLRAEAEAKKRALVSKEIDSLPGIVKEIAQEDEEKRRRHIRRVTAKRERLRSLPTRLGKHKFQPAPMQVQLSEDISGSLRKLKGCYNLARDRFKSLEKRGLVVPRAGFSRN